jgi:hypothetical protein
MQKRMDTMAHLARSMGYTDTYLPEVQNSRSDTINRDLEVLKAERIEAKYIALADDAGVERASLFTSDVSG